MQLKYIVVGTGRSGTVYLARVLSSLGVPCGHESVFTFLGIREACRRLQHPERIHRSRLTQTICADWNLDDKAIVADSSYMAAPYLGHWVCRDASILHVVRHPLKVISSFVLSFQYFHVSQWHDQLPPGSDPGWFYHRFIYKHAPQLKQKMEICSRACLYYVLWNQMIERNARHNDYIRYRIEDDNELSLRSLLGAAQELPIYADKTINKGEHAKQLCYKDIPPGAIRDELMAMSKRYAYQLR